MEFPGEFYLIEGRYLAGLWVLAKRLYSERRFSGDEMRDQAQWIQHAVLELAVEVPDEWIASQGGAGAPPGG
jgi:hypothetical protein